MLKVNGFTMRYEPYEDEYAAIPAMTDAQLLEYFISRVYETEEVWGLKEGGAYWMTYGRDGREIQPLFAYKRYAEEAAVGDWEVMIPVAESLEFFMERTLTRLEQNDVVLEVMPRETGRGSLVTPRQLFGILEGIIDAGEYTMEG
ncbi:DUF2750 domain-containing protein [Methylomarinum vadi]|uniref:DUF2750 domain-containing protein n=1 Tax=Methylomarinum vadi TaxID=438855 RepID=UPI001F361F02|nr:DUF2750 domain-containing protein [Methylomarinum vadi]